MLFILLLLFVGQEPKDSQSITVQQMFEACRSLGAIAHRRQIAMINGKIKILALVKKAKISTKEKQVVSWKLDEATLEPTNVVVSFPSKKDRAAYETQLVKEIMEDKQQLKATKPLRIPEMYSDKITTFGRPFNGVFVVNNIIDKETCLIRLPPTGESKRYCLKGCDTSEFADDMRIVTEDLFVRDGVYKDGSSTFIALRVLTKQESEELAAMFDEVDMREKTRKWTNNEGTFSASAKLVGFDLKTVKLQKDDGKVVELPIEKLSDGDKEYVGRSMGLEPIYP
jgi:hypothetical protein